MAEQRPGFPTCENRAPIHAGQGPGLDNVRLGEKGPAIATGAESGPKALGLNFIIALTGLYPSRS